jgi:hypothetical protein
LAGAAGYGFTEEWEGALTKTFNYGYATCYWKMYDILKAMPRVTIYYERYGTIKVYYTHPNTTGVEVHFAQVDATHTKVDVTSGSSSAKSWIARNLFAETVKKEETTFMDTDDSSPSTTKDW